jgi:N-formylglutamate amidohydrolase
MKIMIDRLSVEEIIKKINAEECVHAVSSDYSFIIKIDKYVPYACAAIHDGHQLREELWSNCLHSAYERWYEEDPETKNMVASQPIVISANDSRFEYDLNRETEDAIFETAWGKQLWKTPLSKEQVQKSLSKHTNFYKIVNALVGKLEHKFGIAIVYDMHSYNWKRWDREVPTWNLGTKNIDNNRFGEDIEMWQTMLTEIKFPYGIKSTALINNTFYGNGYFLKYITKTFKNTLVLATEVAKVYCDEYNQIIYPEIVNLIETQLRNRIKEHATLFVNRHTK